MIFASIAALHEQPGRRYATRFQGLDVLSCEFVGYAGMSLDAYDIGKAHPDYKYMFCVSRDVTLEVAGIVKLRCEYHGSLAQSLARGYVSTPIVSGHLTYHQVMVPLPTSWSFRPLSSYPVDPIIEGVTGVPGDSTIAAQSYGYGFNGTMTFRCEYYSHESTFKYFTPNAPGGPIMGGAGAYVTQKLWAIYSWGPATGSSSEIFFYPGPSSHTFGSLAFELNCTAMSVEPDGKWFNVSETWAMEYVPAPAT